MVDYELVNVIYQISKRNKTKKKTIPSWSHSVWSNQRLHRSSIFFFFFLFLPLFYCHPFRFDYYYFLNIYLQTIHFIKFPNPAEAEPTNRKRTYKKKLYPLFDIFLDVYFNWPRFSNRLNDVANAGQLMMSQKHHKKNVENSPCGKMSN